MSATITHETTALRSDTVTDQTPVAASAAASTGSVPFPNGPVSAPDHSKAFSITSFVLGIASVVSGWTFFAPITGLIFGILALRRGTPERALAFWGVWLNAAMLAIWVVIAIAIGAAAALGLVVIPFL